MSKIVFKHEFVDATEPFLSCLSHKAGIAPPTRQAWLHTDGCKGRRLGHDGRQAAGQESLNPALGDSTISIFPDVQTNT